MPLDRYRLIEYPSLHDMSHQFPPVDWLWPSWIPHGMLTLFGAAPGVGKSLVALDLARRIIHGHPFPDGAPGSYRGGEVLIVDAEGAPALLNQRAQAWHIDSRRLCLMLSPDFDGFIDLAQPRQLEQLRRMINDIRPALVVVDSLAAATSSGETSLQGARAILGSLSNLADMFDTAFLVIHHLRKRARSGAAATAPQVAIDDLRGSSHISAAARSVLALSLVPTSPAFPLSPSPPPSPLRRLEIVKTNLCSHPPPLALHLEGENVPVPTLRYSAWVEPPPQPTQLDLRAQWLLQFLAAAGAPVKPVDVVRAAAGEGFPRATLYRARQALTGRVMDLGNSPHDPNKRWTLAAEPTAPHEDTHRDSPPL